MSEKKMSSNPTNKTAIVLLSGGLDSATCLYEAKSQGYEVIALSFSYEQKHKIELQFADKLCEIAKVKEHVHLSIDFSKIGGSALTSDLAVPKDALDDNAAEIPVTYVPARNIIFLSIAASLAEARNSNEIFIGVNALDYSGYPDCRPEFIQSFSQALNLGTKKGIKGNPFAIHTPLIAFSKKQIILRGKELMVPYQYTWSCYDPQPSPRILAASYLTTYLPCHHCDSCLLRARGFAETGMADPLLASF